MTNVRRAHGTRGAMSQHEREEIEAFGEEAFAETRRPLVLIAEPDTACRTAFVEVLRGAGYGVASIPDPSRTVDEAARLMPALIIARVTDPVTDGFSLCRDVRASAETRATPLLVLTEQDMYERLLGSPVERSTWLREAAADCTYEVKESKHQVG